MKVGFISLGCPKNQVDSEMMIEKLASAGFEISDDLGSIDIVVINTCAFIDDAKKEAIENILDMVSMKEDGEIKKIVVAGCLAERFKAEIIKEIPEVDAVVGLGANGDIVEVLTAVAAGEEHKIIHPPVSDMPLDDARILTTPEHWAYLKVADGCSNHCSYCVIPSIRGEFRSRTIESVVEEAKQLADDGVREIIVIAQDTTRYGEDLYGEKKLPELLDKLETIENLKWVRLLYCYPDRITDELLDAMARNKKVLHYIDLPLQHCNRDILHRMNRTGDKDSLLALINHIRTKLPDAILRSTLIVGFPGETDEQFEELCEFVKEAEIDRLGCFEYSAEEGTPAATFDDQISDEVKCERGEILMNIQHEIFERKLNANVGKILEVVVDGYDGYTDSYFGRAWTDAPDIDSVAIMTCDYDLFEGDIVKVRIFNVIDGNLIGEVVE
ncbi:MAG TPA: 30S ribosomal protein S12 methylthiotransferase RimO [Clostridiales bacterium]|nr:30S ribosomal protein S12 methylthiotransferase RimO [Clostridiales bacterium]